MPSKRMLRRPKHWLAAGLLGVAGVAGYTQLDEWQRQQIFSVEDSQRWWREAPEGTEIFDLELPNGHHVRTGTGSIPIRMPLPCFICMGLAGT